MCLINPIVSNKWLEDHKKELEISLEDFNTLKQIQGLLNSEDWEETRNDDNNEKMIQKINTLDYLNHPTTISCVYIVRNEEKHIISSIKSVNSLVDEIIIVDTGSTDDTLTKIRELKNSKIKVFHFTWCDDFSKARNYAISKATSTWLLILDADEIIEENTILKFLLTYLISIDDFNDTVFNLNVIRGEDSYKTGKVVKNSSNLKYKGRVHEIFYSENQEVSYANIKLNIFGIKRVSQKKIEYYNSLLLETMKDYPYDSRWGYLFLRDNFKNLSFQQMLSYSKQAIINDENDISESNYIWNYYSVKILLLMYKTLETDDDETFLYLLKIIESKCYSLEDVIYLKYCYEIKKYLEYGSFKLAQFLNDFVNSDDSDNIFSKNAKHSLLATFLFLGGFPEKSKNIFNELNKKDNDITYFLNKNFIDDWLK